MSKKARHNFVDADGNVILRQRTKLRPRGADRCEWHWLDEPAGFDDFAIDVTLDMEQNATSGTGVALS